jgi:hypothetical protein
MSSSVAEFASFSPPCNGGTSTTLRAGMCNFAESCMMSMHYVYKFKFKFKFKLYCNRRSVGQFVFVSYTIWNKLTRFYISESDSYFLSFSCTL